MSYREVVTARPTHAFLGSLARIGLSVMVAVTTVTAAAVATGQTSMPLHVLAAARVAAGVNGASAPPIWVARAAELRVDPGMNLPMAGVVSNARDYTTALLDEMAAQQAADEAAAS